MQHEPSTSETWTSAKSFDPRPCTVLFHKEGFAAARASRPARFVKSDIVEKVLLRDLPQLYGINDIHELNALFMLLAYNSGEQVSLED